MLVVDNKGKIFDDRRKEDRRINNEDVKKDKRKGKERRTLDQTNNKKK